MERVDADPDALALDHFPGVRELAGFVGTERKINGAARLFTAEHAAGVGAVGGDDFAIGETHVGEKALVALHENAADQSRLEDHALVIAEEPANSQYAGKDSHFEMTLKDIFLEVTRLLC